MNTFETGTGYSIELINNRLKLRENTKTCLYMNLLVAQ